jgi:hypothetical protein
MAKRKSAKPADQGRYLPAKKPRAGTKAKPDPVELDSRDSFPASDPPSWIPVTGEGAPDRTGRKRQR